LKNLAETESESSTENETKSKMAFVRYGSSSNQRIEDTTVHVALSIHSLIDSSSFCQSLDLASLLSRFLDGISAPGLHKVSSTSLSPKSEDSRVVPLAFFLLPKQGRLHLVLLYVLEVKYHSSGKTAAFEPTS
jgi:hypothetical protein